jgi:hypothetical protein
MLVPSLGKSYLQFARAAFPFAVLEVFLDPAVRTDSLPAFSGVTVETVTTLAAVANLRPEYEGLGCSSGCVLPFSLHEWHLTWCRHFLGCNPHIQDEPLFYVLRNFSGACVAILPFIVSRHRLGPSKSCPSVCWEPILPSRKFAFPWSSVATSC